MVRLSEQKLLAKIEYGEHKAEFSGDFDAVAREIMKFLFDISPALSTLSRIKLDVDLDELTRDLQGVIKVAKEGVLLLVPKEKLIGPDLICLYLVGTYVGFRLGMLEKDSMSVDELSQFTGIKKAVVSVRLAELGRNRIVISSDSGERKISALGIEYFRGTVLPKVKAS